MSKETYADFLFKMEKGGVDIPWFRKPHPHTKEEKAMNPEQIWTMIQTNASEQFPDEEDAQAISLYLATEQGSKLYDQYLQAKEGGPSEPSEPPSEPSEPTNMTKGEEIQKAALNRLERLAKERQAIHKGAMTYEQAYTEVLSENPHLYTAARP